MESQLADLSASVDQLLGANRYLGQSDIRKWFKSLPDISNELAHPYFDANLLAPEHRISISKITSLRSPASQLLAERNERYVSEAISRYSDLFSSLEKYPLTDEQMRAAVVDEDRNLLIAAAGSGKSSTIVAKVVYLLQNNLARPEEILVLAYNKDAQNDIDQRLKSLEDKVSFDEGGVRASTFHGLGMEILVRAENVKPSISEMATAGKSRLSKIFLDIINGIAQRDPQFSRQWNEFLAITKNATPDLFEINTRGEYEDYLSEIGAKRKESPLGESRLVLPTMDGREVKSMEEARIANWLFLNGIEYEYERRYQKDTATESRRQYYPDFYYPEFDLYHEHFALDQNGMPPGFIGNSYLEGVRWKRKLHSESGTKLIETHSADFREGTVFEKLEDSLSQHGITPKPRPHEEIDELIKKTFNPETDIGVISTFLRHFKANSATIESVRERSKHEHDQVRIRLFLDLFGKIYHDYQSRLHSRKEIDFEDQINKACDYMNGGKYQHAYKYILVDEFQDISQDRKRLIDALLNQADDIKLFAVGDDWQSIYRFSGADIDIMTHFSDHFGATSQNYLTRTFRSYQGIVDVASTFIQRNPDQIKKTVHAAEDVDGDLVVLQDYESESAQQDIVEEILDKLNRLAKKEKVQLSVFLLARYNHQRPRSLSTYSTRYPNLDIEFKTIHASKGLEADYVLLLNLEAGAYGFPSTITDDPLLHLVIPRTETFPDAEERRLLYVAITRAKRAAFICASRKDPSEFARELAEIPRVKTSSRWKRTHPCPSCDTGDLQRKIGRHGAFWGCSNYPDCQYTESVVCPECGKGKLVERKSQYGSFLGCNQFPRCRYKESL